MNPKQIGKEEKIAFIKNMIKDIKMYPHIPITGKRPTELQEGIYDHFEKMYDKYFQQPTLTVEQDKSNIDYRDDNMFFDIDEPIKTPLWEDDKVEQERDIEQLAEKAYPFINKRKLNLGETGLLREGFKTGYAANTVNKELLEAAQKVSTILDFVINATETGTNRNHHLTDANIWIKSAIEKLKH